MTTELSTFTFETNSIRTLTLNNDPWFIATDVCLALGLTQTTNALRNLDEDEVALTSIKGISKGNDQVNIISESGMYTLILRCREAVKKGSVPHRFRKWVTAEVLPAIRKVGKYEHPKTTVDDRTGLRDAVNLIVGKKGLIYSEAYNLIHQYMNVQHIDEIPKEKLPMAVAYCHKIVLEGELIIDEPKTDTERMLNLNSEGVNAVINCFYSATRMQEAVRFLLTSLRTFHGGSLDSVRFNFEVMDKYIRETQPHVERLVKQRYKPQTPHIGNQKRFAA